MNLIDENGKDNIAVVTGSSKGIGLAIVKHYISKGFKVFMLSSSQDNLHSAKKTLESDSEELRLADRIITIQCNLTDEIEVGKAFAEITKKTNYINVLVNNCGGLSLDHLGTFQDLKAVDWQHCFDLNIMTTVFATQGAYPLLLNAKWRRVISISSITAVQPGFHNPHYAAMKAAVLALSKNLSLNWAKDQILVNCVSPGVTETEGWSNFITTQAKNKQCSWQQAYEDENERVKDTVPLGRLAKTEEIAKLVYFLGSEDNSYITGENVLIDGGKYRGI